MTPALPLRAFIRACIACALLAAAHVALAQASATVSVESDYRFRGVSLGGNRPSLRAEVAWDGAQGWYAGASGTRARFAGGDRYSLLTAYGGRVVPLMASLDLDIGASGWAFSSGGFDFAEAYVGLVAPSWSLRLNGSPDYFGQHVATLYVDANAQRLLTDTVRVFVHAGELVATSAPRHAMSAYDYSSASTYATGTSRSRWDVRAGIGWNVSAHVDLQLAWTAAAHGGPVPSPQPGRGSGWIAGAFFSF